MVERRQSCVVTSDEAEQRCAGTDVKGVSDETSESERDLGY